MLSFTLLDTGLGRTGTAAQLLPVTTPAGGGAAPAAYAAPTDPGPTVNIGPFTFNQDQISNLSTKKVMTIPVGRLSSTHSDPSYVPAEWAPWLQTILLKPWAGSNAAGHPNGFGNYWYNDSIAGDHLDPSCAMDSSGNGKIVHSIGWLNEPIKQQSYRDWMTALGIGPDQDYFMGMIGMLSTGLAVQDVALWWNHLPVATFTNPNDGLIYGIWLQLTARDTTYVNVGKPTESYWQSINTWPCPQGGFDSPFDLDMKIATVDFANSMRPANTSLFQYLNPANWLGYIASFIWNDIVKPLDCALIRGIPQGPGAAAAASKLGWVGTAVQLVGMFAQCGVTGTPDCTNPANAKNPACMQTQPVVLAPTGPWYTQWWGIAMLAAIGVGGVLIFRSAGSRRAS